MIQRSVLHNMINMIQTNKDLCCVLFKSVVQIFILRLVVNISVEVHDTKGPSAKHPAGIQGGARLGGNSQSAE